MRLVCALVLGTAIFCAAAHAEVLEIGGSTVVVKDTLQPAIASIKESTGVEVKALGMGSGRGMVSLFEGKSGMAAISESLDEAMASARVTMTEMGLKTPVPANLVYHEIGRDRIAVFVHRDNPVGAMTKAQLRDLFTGKVRNWKEVGGPDLPVKVFLSSPGSGTRATFQKLALDGAEYSQQATDFRSSLASVSEVGKDRGGIGIAGPTLLDDVRTPVRIASAPAVERPIALVTVGRPSDAAQKVIEHLRRKK